MATPEELAAYKIMRLADVQTELEKRVNAAVSDYDVKRFLRRAVRFLAKGNNITNAERNEMTAFNNTMSALDPIEAAAAVAKARINALTEIPEDDSFLVQW